MNELPTKHVTFCDFDKISRVEVSYLKLEKKNRIYISVFNPIEDASVDECTEYLADVALSPTKAREIAYTLIQQADYLEGVDDE